jgi:hypothetical protein
MVDALTMEFNDFPWTCPHALSAICASGVDDSDFSLHKLNGIFGANTNAAATEVAFAGNDVNHQWCVSCHLSLFTLI